jgi:hypothetical protein
MTCLHIAADKEDMKMVKYLCELNIDTEMLMATYDEVSSKYFGEPTTLSIQCCRNAPGAFLYFNIAQAISNIIYVGMNVETPALELLLVCAGLIVIWDGALWF